MADAPSGSKTPAPAPKAIGSLAKKQSDVTRQGTSKLKFVPTLPQRRKKEEVKTEPAPAVIPAATPTERGRGRGRGAGRGDGGRGRGRGRGGPPEVVMTASGPFAMGPAMAGSAGSRRSTPRSNFAPSVAPSTSGSSSLGAGLSHTAPPSLKKDNDLKGKGKEVKQEEEDVEIYSDPEDGVEIIDMDQVRSMDWMAPESLRKERPSSKKPKKEKVEPETLTGDVDAANALDLSESEEEEEEPELEDIIEDFATQVNIDSEDASLREERLYLFQFPSPFPSFLPNPKASPEPVPDNQDVEMTDGTKKVSFGPDVKPPAADATPATSRTASTAPSEAPKPEPLDGLVGRLEVYRSGAVKIRLADGIVLDVTPATQPSFLQQAVYIDRKDNRLAVLGEVNKQFVVAPDVEALLEALDEADKQPLAPIIEGEEKLLKM